MGFEKDHVAIIGRFAGASMKRLDKHPAVGFLLCKASEETFVHPVVRVIYTLEKFPEELNEIENLSELQLICRTKHLRVCGFAMTSDANPLEMSPTASTILEILCNHEPKAFRVLFSTCDCDTACFGRNEDTLEEMPLNVACDVKGKERSRLSSFQLGTKPSFKRNLSNMPPATNLTLPSCSEFGVFGGVALFPCCVTSQSLMASSAGSDSDQSMTTLASRTSASRPSRHLGPARKAKQNLDLQKKLKAKGDLEVPWMGSQQKQDKDRMTAAGAAMFLDGEAVGARGSVAGQWYREFVHRMGDLDLSGTGDNVYKMIEELEFTQDVGDELNDFPADVKDACERTFFNQVAGSDCICMVCNKQSWDTAVPFSRTHEPHRNSKVHKEVRTSRK